MTETSDYSLQELESALAEIDLLNELAMIYPVIAFVGRTLQSVMNGTLEGNKLEFGVLRGALFSPNTGSQRHIVKLFTEKMKDFEWGDSALTCKASNGVPIIIKIYDKHNRFFKHMDQYFYNYVNVPYFTHPNGNRGDIMVTDGCFSLPNPWRLFLESEGYYSKRVSKEESILKRAKDAEKQQKISRKQRAVM